LRAAAWCAFVGVQVNGKVFRIGHLGNMDELMMCSAISGAEMAMLDAGRWIGSRLCTARYCTALANTCFRGIAAGMCAR
jgi:aspartate aminotransferase-like enzyme